MSADLSTWLLAMDEQDEHGREKATREVLSERVKFSPSVALRTLTDDGPSLRF